MYFSARKVPKAALIAMQRPTPRGALTAACLIVLARLRTAAVTTVRIRSRPLTRPQIVIRGHGCFGVALHPAWLRCRYALTAKNSVQHCFLNAVTLSR